MERCYTTVSIRHGHSRRASWRPARKCRRS
jgi:hypothetical protein